MNKKMKLLLGGGLVVLAVAGCAGLSGLGGTGTQTVPFTLKNGGSITNACPGVFYGYAKMTNSTGTFWITPPTNTASGTLTDVSGFGPPYASFACVNCNNFTTWCHSNSVTFPVASKLEYTLTVYVTSTPPPTNGQPISLQITWQ
jgi:hypothetical protein